MGSRKRIVMTTDTYWPRINGVTVAVEGFRRVMLGLINERDRAKFLQRDPALARR